MLRPVNFLIMDEPTNHLDIDSREALEEALLGYDGTLLMVSHDRYFINKLADRIIYMEPDGFRNYIGGYDDYAEARSRERTEATLTAAPKSGNTDYQEQKRRQAEKRKVLNRFKKVEEQIEALEEEIASVSEEMSAPALASDFEKLGELSKRADERNAELEELMEEWEALQIEIEEKGYEE